MRPWRWRARGEEKRREEKKKGIKRRDAEGAEISQRKKRTRPWLDARGASSFSCALTDGSRVLGRDTLMP
jgi:hypothetical protein